MLEARNHRNRITRSAAGGTSQDPIDGSEHPEPGNRFQLGQPGTAVQGLPRQKEAEAAETVESGPGRPGPDLIPPPLVMAAHEGRTGDRKSTRLNSSHSV